MYPKNDLTQIYFKIPTNDRLSSRLPDYTLKTNLYYISKAINCCDSWSSFLDIGAGNGHYSVPLLSKFEQGTAVEMDKSEELLSLKEKYNNITTIIGTIKDLDKNAKFDFILMADVFEHIPLIEINEFVIHLSNIQNPGSVIYILTPNPLYCGPATKSSLYYKLNNGGHHGHQKHYLPQEITNLLSTLGYELIFLKYSEGKISQIIKSLIFRLSMRDKKYRGQIIYKIISPLFIYPLKFSLYLLGEISHLAEILKSENNFEMRSQTLVFKKCRIR